MLVGFVLQVVSLVVSILGSLWTWSIRAAPEVDIRVLQYAHVAHIVALACTITLTFTTSIYPLVEHYTSTALQLTVIASLWLQVSGCRLLKGSPN